MASLVDQYEMKNNATLRKQVAAATWIAAEAIVNEVVTVENHRSRLKWAETVKALPDSNLIDRMVYAAVQNPTLQASAPAGPWNDNDIQFVVNANVDLQATSIF